MEKIKLTDNYQISQVIKGNWQLSSGHDLTQKHRSEDEILKDLAAFYEAGVTTFDFGDIYTGVEALMGKFIKELCARYGASARETVQLHTKYVPDRNLLSSHRPEHVRATVNRSRQRMGIEKLDLVQFHWWDYEVPGYVEALTTLFTLKEEGVIRNVGITNFDSQRLQEFLSADLKPLSVQVQYSLLDRRPENGFAALCEQNGIALFCYGTVAGGFLSERYLGVPEPSDVENRSLVKYRLIIEEFGGWEQFQKLLHVLSQVAKKHCLDIATVASALILEKPAVAGVIVGAKDRSHLDQNLKIAELRLDKKDKAAVQEVLSQSPGPKGDIYDLERNNPTHAGIMRTNLNKE